MNTAAEEANMTEDEKVDVLCIAPLVLALFTLEVLDCVMEGAAGVTGTVEVADGAADELIEVLLIGNVLLPSL